MPSPAEIQSIANHLRVAADHLFQAEQEARNLNIEEYLRDEDTDLGLTSLLHQVENLAEVVGDDA